VIRSDAAWAPILTGEAKAEALSAVDDIAVALQSSVTDQSSLSGGNAGIALFFGFLSEVREQAKEETLDIACRFLRLAFDTTRDSVTSPSLYGGFTGIGWAAERFRPLVSFDEDVNSDVDAALGRYLAERQPRCGYELLNGLVGFGVYAIERRNRTLVEAVIRRLREMAEITDDGVTWFTPPQHYPEAVRQRLPHGYYNLGVAHGVPAAITFLAWACAFDFGADTARMLLDGAVRWLLSKRITGKGGCFPSMLSPDIEEAAPHSRLSWCYGDLGISLTLLGAARCVGDSSWEAEALGIARHATRIPAVIGGTLDAGICHGAGGNAHLFNRLYQATREPVFLDAALRWFKLTLSLRRPETGIGGFQAWRPEEGWQSRPGLLDGSAGIGLALLAGLGGVIPDWDRMLLVSVDPR